MPRRITTIAGLTRACYFCRVGETLPKGLITEDGTMQVSQHNAHVLLKRHGIPMQVHCSCASWIEGETYRARVMWSVEGGTGTVLFHDFTGYAWGYGGTGPRGLRDFFGALGGGQEPKLWRKPEHVFHRGVNYHGEPFSMDDVGLMVFWKDPTDEQWVFAFGKPEERDELRARARELLAKKIREKGGHASEFTEVERLVVES